MSNGVEISQQAIPLSRAADYQKVLDSRWKLLEILYEKVFSLNFPSATISGSGRAYQKLMDAPAGFVTPFEFVIIDTGGNNEYRIWSMKDGYYIELLQSGAPTDATPTIFLRVYNLNILETYQAPPDISFPGNKIDQETYGLRILQGAKTNHAMQDTDMSKFSINTSAKPFQLHMHGIKTAVSSSIVLAHRLGYLPTFFIAEYGATLSLAFGFPDYMLNKPYVTGFGTTTAVARADTTNISLVGAGVTLTGTYAYLILKDPVAVKQ